MLEVSTLPYSVSMFPGIADRVYFQHPETKEFWFHATDVCKTLGFTNVTSAIALHCEPDEKIQEIWQGKATWFVSEAGCYGLAMGAKNDVAKAFKRWLKHEVLPKLRASGGYIMPSATSEQLEALQTEIEQMRHRLGIVTGTMQNLFSSRGAFPVQIKNWDAFRSFMETGGLGIYFCNATLDKLKAHYKFRGESFRQLISENRLPEVIEKLYEFMQESSVDNHKRLKEMFPYFCK